MIDPELLKQIEETRAKHEFLTFLILDDDPDWRCGVVQNSDKRFIMFYDLARIRDEAAQMRFLDYADQWWWESGRSLPIDSYIGPAFDEFQPALSGVARKILKAEPIGPTYSLVDQYLKRVKKRRIDLVNRRRLDAA